MYLRANLVVLLSVFFLMADGHAQDRVRSKRAPPSPAEEARIASDMVMNDGLLQPGDLVVTDRGLLMFRGLAADGYTNEFIRVPNASSIGRVGR